MPDEVEEIKKELDPIEFGFDKEGYLKIKIHLSAGLWNILGALSEAQVRVLGQFGRMAEAEEKRKGLVRPDGFLKRFGNKWR